MKNLKGFSQLNENRTKDIFGDVDDAYYTLNTLHMLMDKGYFNNDGTPKQSREDINAFLKDEIGNKEYFGSQDDLDYFTTDVRTQLEVLIKALPE